MNSGVVYALAAYVIWGLFPLYFKALEQVPSLQILAHRMAWSLLFVALLLAVLKRWSWMRLLREQPALLARFALSAVLLSSNWGIYIWAVNSNHVVDASLGYYINPLVNVALGSVLLHERLRGLQWVALAIAAAGVTVMAIEVGHVPWISLSLALTFGSYALLRKTAPLGALEGLAVETAVLFPLAVAYLFWLSTQGMNAFASADLSTRWLLVAAGPITTIPLLLFAAGARRMSMTLLGVLQYITPTLQLALGVWLYHEPFAAAKMVGFGLVWVGLAVFLLDGLRAAWGRPATTLPSLDDGVAAPPKL
ncbi:Protein RarD [Thiomonas arsenitoxydans]|uniref:Permease of the drug/metabolite transporter (DMT) superfamily RarD domain n=1 Tax=Thiomonas arsenitoxydans (strain DSM 22701 / CIP 110005 / 3As) TaxID=426114 RepID=D6CN88_THIA3|nr:EamA family transporter RarD [Thiomonas arsenitoxydans]CAZ90016.1 putative Permease of the drug/metabolite transporter (DMT) superfamily; RarD domain [Thiomonas arsenitoxydans]CQR37306.1 Protein RarD [Thiomonas arsenitoxydans]CQR38382.1 Protein RarD [Thiomonas arsenitoxydans]CQR40215.1 Protein RarD [Thiomonas arsenitoxydans]CQR40283.1 Protein RarD [Thiomonas arsenitoxydans]